MGLTEWIETAREAKEVVGVEVFVLEWVEHLLNWFRKRLSVSVPNADCRSSINRGFNVLN